MEEQTTPMPQYSTGKREAVFGIFILIFSLALANCTIYGGFNLGFSLAGLGCLAAGVLYLKRKCSAYGWVLLGLCALILPGFSRADDGFVKFVLLCFLFVAANLGLTTVAGRNRRDTATVHSLLDAPRAFFMLGFGKLSTAYRGARHAVASGGSGVKKTGSVLLGGLIALPILAIMIPLLMRSDAAFEGLLDLLPEFDGREAAGTAIFGAAIACIHYTRAVALKQDTCDAPVEVKEHKGLASLTMNTVLGAVCLLYGVYLASQLAYFVGGFSGILPEGYSLAQYARRGFFEMAWLCAINLSVMIFGISVTEKRDQKTPLSTRLLCLFIGLVTEFLVIAAGAKMTFYIGVYGMTRLRVLTMVIVAFLGLTTAVVSLWLFISKLPYMKIVLVAALVMGAAVMWADVDTVVAGYNVEHYLSGQMEIIDVDHLSTLGSGAVPHLDCLAREATDPRVRQEAQAALRYWWLQISDFRDWNYADHVAGQILEHWKPISEDTQILPD